MADIELIDLSGLVWRRGEAARVWYAQPILEFDREPPFIPRLDPSRSTPLDILKAILAKEDEYDAPRDAPTLVLLPELCLDPADIGTVRQLISDSRENTLFVVGFGQMTEEQAVQLQGNRCLWDGPCEGRFTNCALIGCGGREEIYLQPKIVPSQWEVDSHWPGKVVRCFRGGYFLFSVFICSELLDRPQGRSTLAAILDQMQMQSMNLNLAIWVQNNPKPRSQAFIASLEELRRFPSATILIAGTRPNGGARYENFGVSGALVPRTVLPRSFSLLTRAHHYVEPVMTSHPLSRVVLLRYDADVYLAKSVLADTIELTDGVARGALFEYSQPYVLNCRNLHSSTSNKHVTEICACCFDAAMLETPKLASALEIVKRGFSDLSTQRFLSFLDLAIIPRPLQEQERHAAGQQHPNTDAECRCWPHRVCFDLVEHYREPLARVLEGMAGMVYANIQVEPTDELNRHANLELSALSRANLGE